MHRHFILLLQFILIFLLASCQAESTPQSFLPSLTALPQSSSTPIPTQTPLPARVPSFSTATEFITLTRTPDPTNTPRAPKTEPVEELGSITNAVLMQTRDAYSPPWTNPTPTGRPILTPLPSASTQPYQDCQRTPGLVSCDPSAPSVEGRLVFYETEKMALVFTDLKTGQSWQSPAPQPQFMRWSPDGSRLLVQFPNPFKGDFFRSYAVYTPQGVLVKQSGKGEEVSWQAAGAALETYPMPPPIIRSEQGDEAWLEDAENYTNILHIRLAGEALWKSYHLKGIIRNCLYRLYRWVPTTHNLILECPANSVENSLTHGEDFLLFNAETGDLNYLFLNGHLQQGWAEVKGPFLAFIQIDWLYQNRLGILNGRSGMISFPLPPMSEFSFITVRELAWRPGDPPDGSSLVLSVDNANRLNEDELKSQFPANGIYTYNLPSNSFHNLMKTADGWIVGNLHWTNDGQYLFYSTGPIRYPERNQASLYLMRISDGSVWTLATGIADPQDYIGVEAWWSMEALYLPAE